MLQCRYNRLKRNVLSRFLKMLTDGAVRQLSGREFQSLGAATEKRRAAMSMLRGERKEDFVLMILTNATDYMGGLDEQGRPLMTRDRQIAEIGEFIVNLLTHRQPVIVSNTDCVCITFGNFKQHGLSWVFYVSWM